MHRFEYIKLFMEFESDDMPVVYFYEVDPDDGRFARRAIEVFSDRRLRLIDDLYRDVIEALPIPTMDEFNAKAFGEAFRAKMISREEFEEIWKSSAYHGALSAE